MIPLREEIRQSIKDLGLTPMQISLYFYQKHKWIDFRNKHLHTQKTPSSLINENLPILPLKHQFDILTKDIEVIANNLIHCIAIANIYRPYISNYKQAPITLNTADTVYWLHIDLGFRLCSSGWDRVALLLNMVLNLRLNPHCNLAKVIKKLTQDPNYANSHDFKKLQTFYEKDFKDLEDGIGKGRRHEVTHLISRFTRVFFESLEGFLSYTKSTGISAQNEFDILIKHYHLYSSLV